jgi:hypothetical protein
LRGGVGTFRITLVLFSLAAVTLLRRLAREQFFGEIKKEAIQGLKEEIHE